MGSQSRTRLSRDLYFIQFYSFESESEKRFGGSVFSRSVVSDTLGPHGLQHARPPCPSPTPVVYSKLSPIELVMLSNRLICRPLLLQSLLASGNPRDSPESLPTPQFKSINSSALSFLYSPLSHPYMTTGNTITLTRWTFVGKVMSLPFNMLSRLVITFLPRNKHLLISWLLSPTTVIWEPPKIKFCHSFHCFPVYLP